VASSSNVDVGSSAVPLILSIHLLQIYTPMEGCKLS
jgi:hypothetical protein